ncbi:NAD(P)-binding domain-containing protein [Flavobacterium sp. 2]|uniref:NAD(P)-binding domain-containing protein n=1 Tax=Flavobacterium sp. 2 TaxID=308053 RepID=UPI003CEA4AE0
MRIGIIGIGCLTLELAFRSVVSGFEVVIYHPRGSRLMGDIIEKMGSKAQCGSLAEVCSAELVLLFAPKQDLQELIQNMPDMSGKTIVHTSGLIFDPQSLLSGIINAMTYKTTASMLPKAHVVKLFNPVQLNPNASPFRERGREEIFFIAENKEAGNCAAVFLRKLNFAPIDLAGRLHLHGAAASQKMSIGPLWTDPFKNRRNKY